VCVAVHNERMSKSAALTIRLPPALRRSMEARAQSQHRSLSAQVVADLERVAEEPSSALGAGGRFLGLFAGTRLPTDEELGEARRLLWGRIQGARRP